MTHQVLFEVVFEGPCRSTRAGIKVIRVYVAELIEGCHEGGIAFVVREQEGVIRT